MAPGDAEPRTGSRLASTRADALADANWECDFSSSTPARTHLGVAIAPSSRAAGKRRFGRVTSAPRHHHARSDCCSRPDVVLLRDPGTTTGTRCTPGGHGGVLPCGRYLAKFSTWPSLGAECLRSSCRRSVWPRLALGSHLEQLLTLTRSRPGSRHHPLRQAAQGGGGSRHPRREDGASHRRSSCRQRRGDAAGGRRRPRRAKAAEQARSPLQHPSHHVLLRASCRPRPTRAGAAEMEDVPRDRGAGSLSRRRNRLESPSIQLISRRRATHTRSWRWM